MLTGHERLHILRAISPEVRPGFMNVLLEPGGSAFCYWPVAHLGAMLSFGIDLDDQRIWCPSIEFEDNHVPAFGLDDAMGAAIGDRLRAIWPSVLDGIQSDAEREQRDWACDYERAIEWAALDAEVAETVAEMRAADERGDY